MPRDDIVVGMKVTLDEGSISEEIRRAEDRINKPGGRAVGGAPPSVGRGKQQEGHKGLAQEIARAMRMGGGGGGGRAGGGRGGGGGGMLGGMASFAGAGGTLGTIGTIAAGTALGLGVVTAFVAALKGAVAAVMSFARTLQEVSPQVGAGMRQFTIMMRGVMIGIGQNVGQGVWDILRALARTLSLLYQVSAPVFQMIGSVLSHIAMVIEEVVKWIAKKLDIDLDAPYAVATTINQAFLDALSTYTSQQGQQYPPLQYQQSADSAQSSNRPTSSSTQATQVSAPRQVTALTAPNVPQINQTVNYNLDVKLQHEEAVQRAIEQVRGALTRSIIEVRDRQLTMSGMLAAKTTVDMIR